MRIFSRRKLKADIPPERLISRLIPGKNPLLIENKAELIAGNLILKNQVLVHQFLKAAVGLELFQNIGYQRAVEFIGIYIFLILGEQGNIHPILFDGVSQVILQTQALACPCLIDLVGAVDGVGIDDSLLPQHGGDTGTVRLILLCQVTVDRRRSRGQLVLNARDR